MTDADGTSLANKLVCHVLIITFTVFSKTQNALLKITLQSIRMRMEMFAVFFFLKKKV